MKALVYHGPGKLVLEEKPLPVYGPEEVLIRIHTVSICGSDIGAYRHASDRFMPPLVLGHEFSGEIAATGNAITALHQGQRVTVNPMLPCGTCPDCTAGRPNLCSHRRSIGTAIGGIQTHGGMQEYIAVPAKNVIPIDDNVSYSAAALLEPCGVTLACAKKGYTPEEKNVVVLGCGPIGLLVIKFLKAMGIPNIIAVDLMETRLKKAISYGATHTAAGEETARQVILQATDGLGADRIINAAGEKLIPFSLELLRSGGTSVLVALTHAQVTIDPMEIVGRGLTLTGSYMFTSEMEEAADMLADGRLQTEDLVTTTLPLERAEEAFQLLCQPGNQEIKIQLVL